MASGAAVSIRGVSKKYSRDGQEILSNFALDVPAGQVAGIDGPSGVGKSTLLRLIAGIDTEFEGTIEIGGQPISQAPGPGYVFQEPRLLPWETALGNVMVTNPRISERDTLALLADLGLAGCENAYPHELSGGMQRRVALARCLSLNPALILLDEPFVSIDRKLALELQVKFARFIEVQKTTVLLVTHDARDVAQLADRVVRVAGRPLRIVEDRPITTPRLNRADTFVEAEAARLLQSAV